MDKDRMKISAVIPIRKGSQRVPNKNLRDFCGTTLLDLKIQTLLQVPELDEIIVNTDSDEAIQRVIEYGVEKLKFHRRDNSIDGCSGGKVFFNYLGKTTNTDIFVYSPCTTPFIKSETISKCIKQYFELDNKNDSVATGELIKRFMWKDGKTYNYNYSNPPASQDLPDIIIPTFGCCVLSNNLLRKNNNVIGEKPLFILTKEEESIDVDAPMDFFIAEQIYNKKKIEHMI